MGSVCGRLRSYTSAELLPTREECVRIGTGLVEAQLETSSGKIQVELWPDGAYSVRVGEPQAALGEQVFRGNVHERSAAVVGWQREREECCCCTLR